MTEMASNQDEAVTPDGRDTAPTTTPPERPEHVPEKFWDPAAGQLRTEALLKSYLELERRLGTGAPDAPVSEAARAQLLELLGRPGSPDDYLIEPPHGLIEPDPRTQPTPARGRPDPEPGPARLRARRRAPAAGPGRDDRRGRSAAARRAARAPFRRPRSLAGDLPPAQDLGRRQPRAHGPRGVGVELRGRPRLAPDDARERAQAARRRRRRYGQSDRGHAARP